MSAEVLREAAALMRERAGYAPDSPWSADLRPDGRTWVRFAEPDADVSMHGYPAAANHIASWHPAVALAVADWLTGCALVLDVKEGAQMTHALAVARAYLRESS